MLRKFSFDPSNHNATAAEILDTLRKYLARYKLKQRDENRIISMLEESLLRLMSHSSESCSVRRAHTFRDGVHGRHRMSKDRMNVLFRQPCRKSQA